MTLCKQIARTNHISEVVHSDVQALDEQWAKAFVAKAISLGAEVILVIGGFPCKCFSNARGATRENLKNKDFICFWKLK